MLIPASHYMDLTLENSANPNIRMQDIPPNGFQSQNANYSGPNLRRGLASNVGLAMPGRTSFVRIAILPGDPPTTGTQGTSNARYITALSAWNPLERTDFDYYYSQSSIIPRYGMDWLYEGHDVWFTFAIGVFDFPLFAGDAAGGGWDYNQGPPGVGRPIQRCKVFEPTHTDTYIDGNSGFTNNAGHNNHGISIAAQLDTNPGANPQFVKRPDGAAQQSNNWQAPGFCPALIDKAAYWALNWGGGNCGISQGGANNTATWAIRPVVVNQWMYFRWHYKKRDFDGVYSTDPGISAVVAHTLAELQAGQMTEWVQYSGSTNFYVAGTVPFDYDNPVAQVGQSSGNRMLQRPCFQLPGMVYFVTSAPGGGAMAIGHSLSDQWITQAEANAALPGSQSSSPPANTRLPVLSGSAVVGQKPTLDPGDWTGAPSVSLTYQLLRNGAPIADAGASGAITSTIQIPYVFTNADLFTTITATVTATNPSGTLAKTTTGIGPVQAPSSAQVVHEASGSFVSFGTSDSQAITVPQLTNAALIFDFSGKTGGDSLSTVTWKGVPLIPLSSQNKGLARHEVWALVNPSAGAGQLAWSKSGAAQNITWGYTILSGVDPTVPFGTPVQAGALGDSIIGGRKVTVPSSANALVYSAVTFIGPTVPSAGPAASGAQVSRWSVHQSTTQGAAGTANGATSVDMTWSPSGTGSMDWSIIGISVFAYVAPSAVTYQQWRDSFDTTDVDPGCTVQIDPLQLNEHRNILTATIPSGLDAQDTAAGLVTNAARLGNANEGRAMMVLTVPFTTLVANLHILFLLRTAGLYDGTNSVVELYLTAAKRLGWQTRAGILNVTTLNADSGVPLADGDHKVEIAWKQNGFRQMWIDDVLVINDQGLSGATLSANLVAARVGISYYDGAGTDPGATTKFYGLQLSTDSATPLTFPAFGATFKIPLAMTLFSNPNIKRKHRMTRTVSLVLTPFIKKKVRKSLAGSLILSTAFAAIKHKKNVVVGMLLTTALTRKKTHHEAKPATLALTAAMTKFSLKRRALALTVTLAPTSVRKAKHKIVYAISLAYTFTLNFAVNAALRKRVFNVALTTSPAMVRKVSLKRTFPSGMTFTGAISKKIRKPVALGLSTNPALAKKLKPRRILAMTMAMTTSMVRFASLHRVFNVALTLTATMPKKALHTFKALALGMPLRVAMVMKARKPLAVVLHLQVTQSLRKKFQRVLDAPVALATAVQIDSGRSITFMLNLATNTALVKRFSISREMAASATMSSSMNVGSHIKNMVEVVMEMTSTIKPGALVHRATSTVISLVSATLRRS